jgi:hypothetical protein
MQERRGAVRVPLPEEIEATLSGVAVHLVDLSVIGARIEHDGRFSLTAPQLCISWKGTTVTIPVRVARSEIIGRRDGHLVYSSGIQFSTTDPTIDGVVASILRRAEGGDEPAAAAPKLPLAAAPSTMPTPESFDDSWIRKVNFLNNDLDEDNLRYAEFRLTSHGWEKQYISSPEQPENGFTIRRDDLEFAELQRTFEYADPETRRMMQIALTSKLAAENG